MKFENTSVYNIGRAIYSARNPMDSWDKSDTDIDKNILGENDLKLAQKLISGGTEHRKFLRQIFVSVDITAPRYWWSEMDTYKIGTTANSCSTMHKLKDYPITLNMFEVDAHFFGTVDMDYWNNTIDYLEGLRQTYNKTKDYTIFRLLKQALPESFLQKRTVTLNYEVVRTMYQQRKHHKLKEWSINFVEWVNTLPYAKELITYEG